MLQVLSEPDIEKGFDCLLQDLSDLTLDTPEAPQVGKILVKFPSHIIT